MNASAVASTVWKTIRTVGIVLVLVPVALVFGYDDDPMGKPQKRKPS